MTEYPIAYVKSLERELEATKYFVARQNAEIERLMNECKELRDIVATQRNENKYLRNQSGKRCGTCIYAKPTVWGRSKVHVECTNQEHLERYCSNHESTKIRPKNTYACRCYVERECDDNATNKNI